MSELLRFIDASAWTGNWPFLHLKYREMARLKEKLQSVGVQKAMLSPIESILEQDPLRANRQLMNNVKDDSFFSPTPVVDLSYANWPDTVELAAENGRVKLLKLLPNYHRYELEESRLEPLVECAQQHGWTIGVQIRVEDVRGQYPLMKVPDVDVVRAVKTASAFPEQAFVFHNLYLGELGHVLNSNTRIYADTASLEHVDLLEMLKRKYSLDRILFSSHCPFYFAEGNTFKYRFADLTKDEIDKATYRNAEELFKL